MPNSRKADVTAGELTNKQSKAHPAGELTDKQKEALKRDDANVAYGEPDGAHEHEPQLKADTKVVIKEVPAEGDDDKITTSKGVEVNKPDVLAHDPDVKFSEITTETTTIQVPGTALETEEDRKRSRAYEAESEDHADVNRNEHITEYIVGVVTTDPHANLASRSNIVPNAGGAY